MGTSFEPSRELRHELRKLKGRDKRGGTYTQWDVGIRGFRKPTIAPDPILNLYVARLNFRTSAGTAQRYGELRQTVVSPVCLPRDRVAAALRLAA